MTADIRPVDVVKQFIANFERKQRNLMKRKGKLDSYRDQLNRGEALNEEQKKAVEGYEGVLQSLNVVHEVLSQSKDLVSDVEKCVKAEELQKEAEHERYTLSFLHTHVCLMRLLMSLEQNEVRLAVTRASSENSLKMLDTVRRLLLPSISNWPSTVPATLSNIPDFLQTNTEVNLAAQYTLNFVLGRSVPIPIPDDYDGPHKKFNFKEARNLCFRLLATTAVRRSIEQSGHSDSVVSPIQEEVTPHTVEPTNSVHGVYPPNPEFVGHVEDLRTPCDEPIRADIHHPHTQRIDPLSTPNVLDQVIKPLGGTFNFLQASSVLPSDPLVEISAPCAEGPISPQINHAIPDTIENHMPTSNVCYAPPSPSAPEVLYNVDSKEELPEATEKPTCESATMRQLEHTQVAVEPDAPVPTKPISYADLVRRSGYGRPAPQQDHYHTASTQEPRKTEHTTVSEHHAVYDSGDAEPGHPVPTWSRGGRGFNRGFSRGNQGPSRRAVGGARWNRIGAGAGRGAGGGPYRGAPPSVAQPSY